MRYSRIRAAGLRISIQLALLQLLTYPVLAQETGSAQDSPVLRDRFGRHQQRFKLQNSHSPRPIRQQSLETTLGQTDTQQATGESWKKSAMKAGDQPNREPLPGENDPEAELSIPVIQRELQRIEQSTELEQATKTQCIELYRKATEWLASAEDYAKKAAHNRTAIETAPQRIAELRTRLAVPTEPSPALGQDVTRTELEQLLAESELSLQEAQGVVARLDAETKNRSELKSTIPKRIEDTARTLSEVTKQIAAAPSPTEPHLLATARRVELTAQRNALEQSQAKDKSELLRHEALAELFPLERDLAQRRLTRAQKTTAELRQAVAQRRKQESEAEAKEARRQAANAHPALKQIAERNAELAERRKVLAGAIETIAAELQSINEIGEELEEQFKETKEKADIAGLTTTVGLLLRKQRTQLPKVRQYRKRIGFVEREIPNVQLQIMELQDERAPLGDLDAALEEVLSTLKNTTVVAHSDDLRAMTRELLQSRSGYLDSLIGDNETYLTELGDLDLATRKLIAQVQEHALYIDEHVLWISSAGVLQLADFSKAWDGISSCLDPALWLEVLGALGIDALNNPPLIATTLLLCAVLFFAQHRLRTRLCAIGEANRKPLRFAPTVQAVCLTVLCAALWPGLLWFLGWRISSSGQASDFALAVAMGLKTTAVIFGTIEMFRQVCRPKGLAELHFKWYPDSVQVLRRNLSWLKLTGLPLVFVFVMTDTYKAGAWKDSLGRLILIFGMMVLSLAVHRILRPATGVLKSKIAQHPKSWIVRLRYVWCTVGVGLPLLLAALAVAGYFYTAEQLVFRLQATLWMLLALLITHALAMRGLLVARCKMMLKQQLATPQEDNESSDGEGNAISLPDAELDVSVVHHQTRQLIGGVSGFACILGSWLIWAQVLPALGMLDNVVLWTRAAQVPQTVANTDGSVVERMVDGQVPVTLTHLLLCILILVVTTVAAKNLPGFLELTVMQRLPLDAGGRHAISTICRYLLTLVGVSLACRTIGMNWSSVQWLAAGMTVGLGFGLQEIFANFFSGLIMLLERPIRVGDIVTVSGVTGTVSRMHIRATTITDFDRKELIIPNKKFITDDVVNWTLSDPITRVVVPVGVAYGSNTKLARELLLKVAHDHPVILDDPAPSALFSGFGNSTLDIQLRFFIPKRDTYVTVLNDVNSAIDEVFRETGIEIAFPQIDLHVRSVEQTVAALTAASEQRSQRAA